MKRNQKGITLVALVVTIIVLLILAGVSLNLVSGSDGILNRAAGASDRNTAAAQGEQVELMIAELQTDYYEDKYVTNSLTDRNQTADQYIETNLGTKTGYTKTSTGYDVVVTGRKIQVKDGDVVIAENEFTSETNAQLKKEWARPAASNPARE